MNLAKNIGWNSLTGLIQHFLRYLLLVLLTFKLAPSDFAIWGVIAIFVGFSNLFVNSGFSKAIIHSKKLENLQLNTVFFLNIFFAVVLYILIVSNARNIANFFNKDSLSEYIPVGCILILINSLNLVQLALIQKKLNFKRINICRLSSLSVGFVFSIIGAFFFEMKVYALLYFYIINTAIFTILIWYLSNWQPKFNFSFSSIKELFNYSKYLLLNTLMAFSTKNLDTIFIAKFFEFNFLGVYNMAYNVINIPNKFVKAKISEVLFPAFSKIKDIDQILKLHEKMARIVILIVTPVFFSLFNTIEILITSFWDEAWFEIIPLVKYFSITAILISFGFPTQLLLTQGHTKTLLNTTIFSRILIIVLILIGIATKDVFILISCICAGLILHNQLVNVVAFRKLQKNFIPYFVKVLIIPLAINILIFALVKILFLAFDLKYSSIFETILFLGLVFLAYLKRGYLEDALALRKM